MSFNNHRTWIIYTSATMLNIVKSGSDFCNCRNQDELEVFSQ